MSSPLLNTAECVATHRNAKISSSTVNVKHLEYTFLTCFIILSAHNLYTHWGQPQGFDWGPYLKAFRATDWFKPLPQIFDFHYSYHPPLSYLMQRILYKFTQHPYTSGQLLSWLSITGGLLLLRASLNCIGFFKNISSISLFYCIASLPVFIFLSTALTNDTVAFFWFMCSLHLSIKLFWKITENTNKQYWQTLKPSILLVASIIAGLMTKYTGLLSCAIPFFIIFIRQAGILKWHRGNQALIITLTAILLVLPFYYLHYYRPSGKPFPVSMAWKMHNEYQANINKRNHNKLLALKHLFRIPSNAVTSWHQSIPVEDSFFHSIWLQTFKRDLNVSLTSNIKQSTVSAYISDIYGVIFIPITLIGTLAFFIGYHKRRPIWNHLGWLLLLITLLYSAGQVDFAWQYPVWSWRVIKAKYMLPALFWLGYCFALLIHHLQLAHPNTIWQKIVNGVAIAATFTFMAANYILPVY